MTQQQFKELIKDKCVDLHLKGKTNTAIADELNRQGYRTSLGCKVRDSLVSAVLIEAGYRQVTRGNARKIKPIGDINSSIEGRILSNQHISTQDKLIILRLLHKGNI